ncbi:hypothetical protein PV11_09135 [Exophiala sideris]|uniref:Uncharacterized protein n=1 Tax=Exophiala sideris TaxID=1016849 RepID=A0A0D1WQG3_9EURO|nr:hypothetical protein PV11_09135 [Exophiala sideris]
MEGSTQSLDLSRPTDLSLDPEGPLTPPVRPIPAYRRDRRRLPDIEMQAQHDPRLLTSESNVGSTPAPRRDWPLPVCRIVLVALLVVTLWILSPETTDKKTLVALTVLFLCYVGIFAVIARPNPTSFSQNVLAYGPSSLYQNMFPR